MEIGILSRLAFEQLQIKAAICSRLCTSHVFTARILIWSRLAKFNFITAEQVQMWHLSIKWGCSHIVSAKFRGILTRSVCNKTQNLNDIDYDTFSNQILPNPLHVQRLMIRECLHSTKTKDILGNPSPSARPRDFPLALPAGNLLGTSGMDFPIPPSF